MTDGERLQKAEFDHLEQLLAGLGGLPGRQQSRDERMASGLLESHMAERYDRPGCFCYVGWEGGVAQNHPTEQHQIFGALARAAVAGKVFLGALEPNEGVGLAIWAVNPGPRPDRESVRSLAKMRAAVHHAFALLHKEHATNCLLSLTSVVYGCGRLRGSALVAKAPPKGTVLHGSEVVESIYGDVPNRCGAIAKRKDPDVQRLIDSGQLVPGKRRALIYWQPWLRLVPAGRLASAAPQLLFEPVDIAPRLIKDEAKPYLVGCSLDFAQSRLEYAQNPNLARTVVNNVLSDFNSMAERLDGMFVSPRYGDGVSAVIAVVAKTESEVGKAPWATSLLDFCQAATVWLSKCHVLGLRVGLAVGLDNDAATSRLAGVGRTCVPAVESLATDVISRARACHDMAKKQKGKFVTERTALPITNLGADQIDFFKGARDFRK